jgi:hypothetical protein
MVPPLLSILRRAAAVSGPPLLTALGFFVLLPLSC